MQYLQGSILLQSGETFQHDFRSQALKATIYSSPPHNTVQPLKIIQWNIERGYKLSGIIDQLQQLNADIIALQEVDVGCKRSDYIDTGIAIAETLGLNYLYQSEFIELAEPPAEDHPLDEFTPQTEKYSKFRVKSKCYGNHGHAILTKFDFAQWVGVDHTHQAYDWERDGELLGEPRLGKRQTLCAYITLPYYYAYDPQTRETLTTPRQLTALRGDIALADDAQHDPSEDANTTTTPIASTEGADVSPSAHVPESLTAESDSQEAVESLDGFIVTVYTAHFELFCGMIDRIKTLSEIFHHHRQSVSGITSFNKSDPKRSLPFYASFILGDLNTLAHSIARFSPKYCKDQLRWSTLGYSEAEYWYAHVLDYFQEDFAQSCSPKDNVFDAVPYHKRLLQMNLGLSMQQLANIVNPGFNEVFPPTVETLTNYSGWFYGKLDWTLCRHFSAVKRSLYNMNYSASDHRLMLIEGFIPSIPLTNEPVDTKTAPFNSSPIDITVVPLAHPSLDEDRGEDGEQTNNLQKTTYTTIPCEIKGYYQRSRGLYGLLRRNTTPFVKQLISFSLGIFLAFFFLSFVKS